MSSVTVKLKTTDGPCAHRPRFATTKSVRNLFSFRSLKTNKHVFSNNFTQYNVNIAAISDDIGCVSCPGKSRLACRTSPGKRQDQKAQTKGKTTFALA